MIEPPLPFGNAAARWFYVLLKGLVERGHSVTAFATCSNADDVDKAKNLFSSKIYDLRCFPHPTRGGLKAKLETFQKPYSYMFGPELRLSLEAELSRPFDILHLEGLWTGWLGFQRRNRAVLNVHYLFSLDRVFQFPDTFENRIRRLVTHRAEKKLLRFFPRIITVSHRLERHIGQINPKATIHTVPLGIDFSLYPFEEQKPQSKQPVVGLVGSFNWRPSYTAGERLLTRLWPEIKRRVPQSRLLIVGRSAKDSLERFLPVPDLEIHQDVPDILPYFSRMDLLLYAPLAGSGMKVKILEAFALGVPVVTNQEGIEGFPAQDGIHAEICEEDQDLIGRAVKLLSQPELGKKLSSASRKLLEQHCNPQIVITQLEKIYAEVSGQRF
jgi:glycosyltransferase involved in cell wall biosynthesis